MSSVDFAPEYSHAERVRFVVLGIAIGAAVIFVSKLWFFPWIREFSALAPCRSFFGIGGTLVLSYGIFVGIPLFTALSLAASFGRRGYKIVREGRTPPAGEKVFRPTPVVRGPRAKLLGYVQMLVALPFFAFAIWGAFQAQSFVKQLEKAPARCAPNPSVNRTSTSGLRPLAAAGYLKR